jgi:AAA ATPase domain
MSENKGLMSTIFFEGDVPDEWIYKDFKNYYLEKGDLDYSIFQLDGLSNINIFVGANNSGKSRFLRALCKIESFIYSNDMKQTKEIYEELNEIKRQLINRFVWNDLDGSEFLNTLSFIPRGIIENIGSKKHQEIIDKLEMFISNKNEKFKVGTDIVIGDGTTKVDNNYQFRRSLKDFLTEQIISNFKPTIENLESPKTFNKIYIPTLRGLNDVLFYGNMPEILQTGLNLQPGELISNPDRIFSIKSIYEPYFAVTKEKYFYNSKVSSQIMDRRELRDSTAPASIENANIEIITGQNLYYDLKTKLLGESLDREKVKKFEDFLSENFYQDKKIVLIPKHDQKCISVKIGGEERLIHELGDGIQALIILTYPMFLHKGETCLFFIEEPELFMHPGFQRIFLEVLKTFTEFQFFITTHSNHFLDLTLDHENISIFKFDKEGEGEASRFNIENVKPGNINVLEALGVQNSSVFLSNCTIWVEGITDRLYYRHFLKLYMKYLNGDKESKENEESENSNESENSKNSYENTSSDEIPDSDKAKSKLKHTDFKEDLHYSFIEYGGGNGVHFNFEQNKNEQEKINIQNITNKIFLIADGDDYWSYDFKNTKENNEKNPCDQSKAKFLKLHQYQDSLKENFYKLPVIEVENLLSVETIKEIIKEKGYEEDNFNCSSEKEYEGKKLGRFIDKKIQNIKNQKFHVPQIFGNQTKSEKNKTIFIGGTIKAKKDFCKKAIKSMDKYKNLSSEAQKLTKEIYKFIKSKNK